MTIQLPQLAQPLQSEAQGSANATTFERDVAMAHAPDPSWSVTAAAVSRSVVAITMSSSQGGARGPGVVYDTKGHVLTNQRVVAGTGAGSKVSVTLNDKWTCDATVLGNYPATDLAVIKLTNVPSDLKAIALGDANVIEVALQRGLRTLGPAEPR